MSSTTIPRVAEAILNRLLIGFILLLNACGVNAESGDAVCAGLYAKSGAVQGTSSCYANAWGNTSIGMATHYCVNEPSRITRWCGTPPDGVPEASCPVADPVSVSGGATTLVENDFVSGDDSPMVFSRTYRAQPLVRPDSGLGSLWFFSWQRQLNLSSVNSVPPRVTAYRENGNPVVFSKVNGEWRSVGGAALALSQGSSSWTLVDLTTDKSESYSGQGILQSINARDGRVTTLTYSDANTPSTVAPAPGLLIAIAEHAAYTNSSADLTIRLNYDTKWRITQMTDPAGGVVQYSYDAYNNLISVTWPDGSVRRYLYENTNFTSALTGIVDETGSRVSTWTYDSKGRATAVTHPDTSRNVLFAYGNGTTTVTGTRRSTTISFSPIAGVLRSTGDSAGNSTSWDGSGNLVNDVNAKGKSVDYAYDEVNRPTRAAIRIASGTSITSVRYADSLSLRPSVVASPGWVRAYAYDSQGNLTGLSEVSTDDPTGEKGFDASTAGGHKRSYGMSYNSSNQVVFAQLYENGELTGEWSFTRDSTGNMRSVIDRKNGDVVGVYLRDKAHRAIDIDGPGFSATPVYDSRGRLSTFWYEESASPLNGNVTRKLKVAYSYSADGRVVSRTGTVSTNMGPDTPVSNDQIDQWLDNYEVSVIPAGPPVNLQGSVKALQFTQETGLAPVCVECVFYGPRLAWMMFMLARDPMVEVIKGGIKQATEAKQCKPTQPTVDELVDEATKPANETGLTKLSRAWDKHSGRETEYYPPLQGNVDAKNATTESWLRDVLEDPATTRQELSRGGAEYRAPNGTGARYDSDGSFSGVLNPKAPK